MIESKSAKQRRRGYELLRNSLVGTFLAAQTMGYFVGEEDAKRVQQYQQEYSLTDTNAATLVGPKNVSQHIGYGVIAFGYLIGYHNTLDRNN